MSSSSTPSASARSSGALKTSTSRPPVPAWAPAGSSPSSCAPRSASCCDVAARASSALRIRSTVMRWLLSAAIMDSSLRSTVARCTAPASISLADGRMRTDLPTRTTAPVPAAAAPSRASARTSPASSSRSYSTRWPERMPTRSSAFQTGTQTRVPGEPSPPTKTWPVVGSTTCTVPRRSRTLPSVSSRPSPCSPGTTALDPGWRSRGA
mmetsp:Transcript_6324/g.18828  ORF Transcript_6324/g.18828 Transcript_6324/m.18828 type:complete len:209 (-) Transcript_6324:370-996(-)